MGKYLSRSLGAVMANAVTTSTAVMGLPALSAQAAVPSDLTTLVNPLIGTQKEGNTFPGATLPFGMVQVSPDTGYNTGYNYDNSKIWGFSQTHLSGAGCGNATEVPLMPTIGSVATSDPSS